MCLHRRLGLGMWALILAVPMIAQPALGGDMLPGFAAGPCYDEQVRTYTFEPEVTVHVNAPPVQSFDAQRPTRLVIFALPNGNTISQTIGCRNRPGLDWHYNIQHIGAQTRHLREACPEANLVVVYLQAGGKSWPQWRQKHSDSGERIAALIESLRTAVPGNPVTVELTAHSGGGSLIFGLINQVEQIPERIERIVFLDANYGYSDEDRHGDKLLAWLGSSPRHFFGVVAYDDRRVEYNGKLIVGPTGGTYRKTAAMVERFRKDLPLDEDRTEQRTRYRALDGRLDVVVTENPENEILHTVLVEKNGFIHALTLGTPLAGRCGELMAPAVYRDWIQDAEAPIAPPAAAPASPPVD